MLTITPYVRKDHHPLPMGTQGGMLRRLMVEDRGPALIVEAESVGSPTLIFAVRSAIFSIIGSYTRASMIAREHAEHF